MVATSHGKAAKPSNNYYEGRSPARGGVPAWGAGGRWFESSRPDFEKSSVKTEFFYGPLRLYITKFKG